MKNTNSYYLIVNQDTAEVLYEMFGYLDAQNIAKKASYNHKAPMDIWHFTSAGTKSKLVSMVRWK